jgi:UDP-N-acetyl-D-galactosamine dehydrogenase
VNANIKIAIIGLGYVGLPLARLFATKYSVVGFDTNHIRIDELKKGVDQTHEIDENSLKAVLVDRPNNGCYGLYCTTISVSYTHLTLPTTYC